METNQPQSTHSDEQPAPLAPEEARPVRKRAGFWRRTGKVLLWLLLIVLVLGFGSGLLIQLPFFREFVVKQVAGVIADGTNGTLTVGDIQGNLLEGFVMSDVTLRLKTGTAYDTIPLVHVDRMIAKYSLLRFLQTNEIGVSSLVLKHPVVRFVKFAGDTIWNYSLFTKAPAPGTRPKPFTQIIDLANLQIQNGSFYKRDYNYPPVSPVTSTNGNNDIDWNDVEVEGIDLESSVTMHGAISQSARVSHLEFSEKNSGFFVHNLGFQGSLDTTQARIEHATIVTGHSTIGFSIEVASPKIMETGDIRSMQHSMVKASLNGSVISTNELKQFLPVPLGFLGGSPGIDLVAAGEFGKLHIQKLALDFKGQGSIAIAGDLLNLHHPDSLIMNLNLKAKDLSNETLDTYVPGLHLPDLSRFGTINIPNLTFNGPPQKFHTTFDAKSSGAGDASADATFDLRRKPIAYHLGLKTNNFNIAAFTHDPNHESSITARTEIAGHGTNWKTMESNITLRIDSQSTFGKYRVNSLDLAGGINSGTITADHLDAILRGGPEIHVHSAMAELTSPSIPFHFDGSIKNFPLAQAMGNNSKNPARVDLDANLSGTAKDFDDITGTAHIHLFDLACQGHVLPEDTADITVAATPSGGNNLTLHSTIADLTINRKFQTGDLIHILPDHINALLEAIENRDFPRPEEILPLGTATADSIDFDYRVQLKDLRSLADFFPRTFLLAQGSIHGTVSGSAHGDLNLTANGDSLAFILRNRATIDSELMANDSDIAGTSDTTKDSLAAHRADTAALSLPKFGSGTPRIHVQPTTFRLALHNLSNDPKTALGQLDASLDFQTDSVIRLGSALLYHPTVGLIYKHENLDFDASTLYNNALGLNIKGSTSFPEGDLDFAIDRLKLKYKNPYYTPTSGSLREFTWMNEKPAQIRLAKSGILTVDTMQIMHPLNNDDSLIVIGQRMNFGGTLSGDSVNAWANIPSFRVEDLRKILPFNQNAKTFDFAKYQGKVRDVHLGLSGTLEEPDISAKLFADSLNYQGEEEDTITFDSNYVNLEYHDQELRGIMDLHVANVTANEVGGMNPNTLKGSELRATIDSIPMVIALKRGPEYAADSARAVARPLSASIRTTKFPLDIATPFLPPFRQILGTGDINFTVTGTRENIEYAGHATVQNGELLLASTNMRYLFGGSLNFAHDSLVLQNDTIHNISTDDPLGAANLNGSFIFKGFDVTNFDLRLRSNRLMVLSDAAKGSLPAAYGPLTINTGSDDLHFYNTFDAPVLAGTINIMSANVTMPTSNNSGQSVSGQGIIYETLPSYSNHPSARIDTLIAIAKQNNPNLVSSIQPNEKDDSVFPNVLKDIYRNDNGTSENTDSSGTDLDTPKPNALAPSFTDILRMDLSVNTQGDKVTLTIPFGNGAFGDLLGSQIKADLKSGGTIKIQRGDDLQTQANGNFELLPTSTFTFLQTFNITSGHVSFTHDFGNPNIDITAEYISTHQYPPNSTEQAKIVLTVTGSKDHPVITALNYLQTVPGGEFELKPEPSSDIAMQDALYFLGTGGYFMSDNIAGNNAGGHLAQNLATQAGANVFGNIFGGFAGTSNSPIAIKGLSYTPGNNSNAQIALGYRNITVKYGAGTYGMNTVIDIPASEFFSGGGFKNMLFEVQGNFDQSTPTAVLVTQQPIWLSKIIYTFLLW